MVLDYNPINDTVLVNYGFLLSNLIMLCKATELYTLPVLSTYGGNPPLLQVEEGWDRIKELFP